MQTLDILSKFSTLIAALIAACVAGYFGRVQARIAETQAKTAVAAAKTARDKLRHDMFDRRLAAYDAVTLLMDQIKGADLWQKDLNEYHKPLSMLRWLFDYGVWNWYREELLPAIGAITKAQAVCVGIEEGPSLGEARLSVAAAFREFQHQYERRDEVFAPYLHLGG